MQSSTISRKTFCHILRRPRFGGIDDAEGALVVGHIVVVGERGHGKFDRREEDTPSYLITFGAQMIYPTGCFFPLRRRNKTVFARARRFIPESWNFSQCFSSSRVIDLSPG